jgi:hypothetical protein
MARLECTLLFHNIPWAKAYVEKPFEKVHIEPISPDATEDNIVLIDSFWIKRPNQDRKKIERDSNPIDYINYLHMGLSGSYWRATKPEIVERSISKQSRDDLKEIKIPNIDYHPEMANWMHSTKHSHNGQ